MIIATAIVNNANALYSTDNGLKAFSHGYIDIRDLPPLKNTIYSQLKQQGDLFEKGDVEPL